MRILVVDDNRDILDLLRRLFVASSYEVATARDGREALQQYSAFDPHLVILDVNLPYHSGWDLCLQMKSRRSLPVMMLTVRAEPNDYDHSQSAGADAHIIKPFELAGLLDRAEQLLYQYYGIERARIRGQQRY
jgi:DNA-binding response OmpR family regulator